MASRGMSPLRPEQTVRTGGRGLLAVRTDSGRVRVEWGVTRGESAGSPIAIVETKSESALG